MLPHEGIGLYIRGFHHVTQVKLLEGDQENCQENVGDYFRVPRFKVIFIERRYILMKKDPN